MSYYLNALALLIMQRGNAGTAVGMFRESIRLSRRSDEGLSIIMNNLSDCLILLGRYEEAARTVDEALQRAAASAAHDQLIFGHAFLGAILDLTGETAAAEERFVQADRMEHRGRGVHLPSVRGILWGEALLRTGRHTAARRLTEENLARCTEEHWPFSAARARSLLGRILLVEGQVEAAGQHLAEAVETLRDGDRVTDLTAALPDQAEHRRRTGALTDAGRVCGEAIGLAGPRDLVPAHAQALVVRARVRADQGLVEEGRDDADAALHLATFVRRMPWAELEACEAHTVLDEAEGVDRLWRARAAELRARLIPPGLDPDPLGTIEAAEAVSDQEEGA